MVKHLRLFLLAAVAAGLTATVYRFWAAVPLDRNGELVLPFRSVTVTGPRLVLLDFHSPT